MCYCTVLGLFHVAFEGNFQVQAPRSLHDYGGFLRYEFGGGGGVGGGKGIYLEVLIHGGAYFRNFTVLQLCVLYNTDCIFNTTGLQSTRLR